MEKEELVRMSYAIQNYFKIQDLPNKEIILNDIYKELTDLQLFLRKYKFDLSNVVFYYNKILIYISKTNLEVKDKITFEYNFENQTYINNIKEMITNNKSFYIKFIPYFLLAFKKAKMDRLLINTNSFKNQNRRRRIIRNEYS